MSNRAVELRAVSYLNIELSKSKYLSPHIAENDKFPLYDGSVIVYRNENQTNLNIFGFSKVQVKGRNNENLNSKTANYRIDKSDLKIYKIDGGVVLFLVEMNQVNYKIYYKLLLPFDINRLLKQKPKYKSVVLEMAELPVSDPKEVCSIFVEFIVNSRKQTSVSQIDITSFDEFKTTKIPFDKIGFSHGYHKVQHSKDFSDILGKEFYLYATMKDSKIDVPIEKMQLCSIETSINAPIKINDMQFYDSYSLFEDSNTKIIKIGHSLNINVDTRNFKFTLKGSLEDRIIDCSFLIELLKNKVLIINGNIFSLNEINDIESILKTVENQLESLHIIKKTLDKLGVKASIDLDSFNEIDYKKIYVICESVLFDLPHNLVLSNNDGVALLVEIADFKLVFDYEKDIHDPKKIYLKNYFEEGGSKLFDSRGIQLSKYIVLKSNDFEATLNLNFDVILESIKVIEDKSSAFNYHILLVLELIKGFDISGDNKLLSLAQNILNLHIDLESSIMKIIYLNSMQINKRLRNLIPDEVEELIKMKINETDPIILTGINILLESFSEAEIAFQEIPDEQKNEFLQYPICQLWSKKIIQ